MKENNKGFTMAELLIVVAITVVLMGVAFVAVPSYQRSSTRLEYDGIAKEIFIAAQNHLTTAQSQGYLMLESNDNAWSKELGSPDSSSDKIGDERYFLYSAVDTYASNSLESESLLDLMLPFGAIDETVRAGGTYIIRYQPSSGRVLDVFYSLPGKSSMLTVSGLRLEAGHYGSLMSDCRGDEHRKQRENFQGGVVGWYGGEEGLPIGKTLNDPEITVHNEEVLWVEVNDNNSGEGSLKLLVTGVTSGAQKSFLLKPDSENGQVRDETRVSNGTSGYVVILDDLTRSRLHFADLIVDDINKHFIPGENVIIEAVAYNNTALTNVAYSGKKTTNSLFADILEEKTDTESNDTEHVVLVENFRHFENLDKEISDFKDDSAIKKGETTVTISKARQVTDLTWTKETTATPGKKPDSFVEAVEYITKTKPVSIFDKNSTAVTTGSHFYPVSPDYKLEYEGKSNGQNHKVFNVIADHSGNAGLFGTMITGSSVSNLELIDFEIKGTTSAGGLIGTATNTTITNVLAYHTEKTDAYKTPSVTASNGSAGGLIGSATNCTVNKSAAALVVNGSANAGGLIGTSSNSAISLSYAGGHTISTKPAGATGNADVYPSRYDTENYNVTGGTTAGGLIGSMTGGSATSCYSTCSAKAATTGGFVGGFVGTGSGTISNSYCTGLVSGTTAGAFAGSLDTMPSMSSNCKYYEIVNEIHRDDEGNTITGYNYLKPIGNKSREDTKNIITAIDETVATYSEFSGKPDDNWKDAKPYDNALTTFYGKVEGENRKARYNLQTVEQLDKNDWSQNNDNKDAFVRTHYGDWPVPEAFTSNAAS